MILGRFSMEVLDEEEVIFNFTGYGYGAFFIGITRG
jgi:hypothetical protein